MINTIVDLEGSMCCKIRDPLFYLNVILYIWRFDVCYIYMNLNVFLLYM